MTPAQVPPLLPPPTPGLASPALPEPRPAIWPHAVASVILLIFFAWAGSAPASWPKSFTPYTFSQTGWIIPARGIPQILIASAALFLTLSGLARRTLRAPSTPGLHTWIPLLLIAVIALEIHLIFLRAWAPLGFAGIARTAAAWRIAATCANLLSLALLMLALHARKKSPWLAALFIWHPLTLLAAPVAGSGIACLLPLLILAAPPWRWFRWMRELLLITPAALSVWWIAHSALTAAGPVNGLASVMLRDLGLDPRAQAFALIPLAAIFQASLFYLAQKRRWDIATAWSHILIATLLVSPRVDDRLLLPLAALAPLAFVPAAWLATGTALLLFLLKPAGGNVEGEWVLYLTFIPVWVLEIADLRRILTARPTEPQA